MAEIPTPDAAQLQALVAAKLSANAKVIALAMRLNPEMSIRQLSDLTGIARSTVHRAVAEVSHQRDSEGVPNVPSVPPAGQQVSQTSHQRDIPSTKCPTSGTAAKEKSPHTPLKENINKLTTAAAGTESVGSSSKIELAGQDDEIEGLNGSTVQCIETVAGWLHRSAEPGAARAIVADYCQAYGPEKFKIGLLELRQAKRAGRVVDPIASLGQYCKNARLPGETGALGKARADASEAESCFEVNGKTYKRDKWGLENAARNKALIARHCVRKPDAEVVQ